MSERSRKKYLLVERNIGIRLRKFREQMKLSRNIFAKKLGVTPKQIERYEANETEAGIIFLVKLVETFKLSPLWLLTGEGPMFLEEKKEDELDLFLEWLIARKHTFSQEEKYKTLGKLEMCFPDFKAWLKERKT